MKKATPALVTTAGAVPLRLADGDCGYELSEKVLARETRTAGAT